MSSSAIYREPVEPVAIAMTIAGSDSGGGAGLQADLKTFTVLGVYGVSAVTAITAQNTCGVQGVLNLPADIVAAQIDSIMSDIGCHAAKTGMLGNTEIVEAVADRLAYHRVANLVVDPVMAAESGHELLQPVAIGVLVETILPLATVVTPNLPEAEVLLGRSIEAPTAIAEAARALTDLGPAAAIITGGHLCGDATDVLYIRDGDTLRTESVPRIDTPHTHGTGCTFSAALVAYLARGLALPDAFTEAKAFVTRAIRHGLSLGAGNGPLGHIQAGLDS